MRGTHWTAFIERLQDGLDKAVAGVTGQAFAVRAEVRQFAAAIPDRHGRAGGDLLGTGQDVDGFEAAQGARQLAMATGLLHGIEFHAMGCIALDQFDQVLLIADIARTGRVPEMHQTDGARACEVIGKAQRITRKHRRVLAERPQVTPLEPVVGRPQYALSLIHI